MKRRQIPQGYASVVDSHGQPVQSVPPPSIKEQKQAQTLMGHCLKQFIKERMYGNMINYTKARNSRQANFSPHQSNPNMESSLNSKSMASIYEDKRRRFSQIRKNIQKRMDNRYDSVIRKNHYQSASRKERYPSSFGDVEEELTAHDKRNAHNRSAFSNKVQSTQSNDRSIQYNEKYKCSSFLSAIEEDQPSIKKRKNLRLSPILNTQAQPQQMEEAKSPNKSPSKSPLRSPTRLDKDKYQISHSFWELVCRKAKQRIENQSQSMLAHPVLINQASFISSKSMNTNSMLSGKTNVLGINLISVEKSKFLPSKVVFSKDLFNQYMSTAKYVLKNVAQHLMSFFELTGKTFDDMKIEQFKDLTQIMVTAGPRVWAVCAFRFWDLDRNGIICTKDIFNIFKELDKFQEQLKKDNENYQDLRSYKILFLLKKTIQRMRQFIISKDFDQKVEPTNALSEEIDPNFEIKYLQQSIICRKQVRYPDLVLILGEKIKKATRQVKKSVIETTKEINIKLSSCYRYSFLATDHNEQTREDRQYIQTLKENLKKEKIEFIEKSKQNNLLKKKLTGIDYTAFLEGQYHKTMKDIAFLIFGVQLL